VLVFVHLHMHTYLKHTYVHAHTHASMYTCAQEAGPAYSAAHAYAAMAVTAAMRGFLQRQRLVDQMLEVCARRKKGVGL